MEPEGPLACSQWPSTGSSSRGAGEIQCTQLSYSFKTNFPSTARSCKRHFPSDFFLPKFCNIWPLSQACHLPHPSRVLNCTVQEDTSWSFPLCSFVHPYVTSILVGPNILLSIQLWKTLKIYSTLNMTDQVSHAYKTTSKAEHSYEVVSKEKLTSVIKIQNTAWLSCKLTTMILMVWRVANKWQYDAGMQHDGAVVV